MTDYEVGYGKPPKHTQWKPGQSGNPSGRRKPEKTYYELLEEQLKELAWVTENGRTARLTTREALVKAVVNGGIIGEPFCEQLLLIFERPQQSAPKAYCEFRLVIWN